MKMNKIFAVIVCLMLLVAFAFSLFSVIARADYLVDFVVWYALEDGSWSSHTLEEIPADTLLEIGSSAIYQEGIDDPLFTYPYTYDMYTESYAALDGPSDAVSTVSYQLPLEMEANIGYIILHSPQIPSLDGTEDTVELNIVYPAANGVMASFSTYLLDGEVFEITANGIYREGGERLLQFGEPCNAYVFGNVGQYNSDVTPEATLPVELSVYPGMPTISVYNYAPELDAPFIRYNADDDSITWNGVPGYKYQIKTVGPDGNEHLFGTYGMTELKIYPYDYVSELGENVVYVRSVMYAGDDTRLPTYSEWSNGVLWTAELPLINAFFLDGSELNIDVGGKGTVVELYENGLLIEKDLGVGSLVYELTKSGLNGYKIVAMNRYGYVSSDTVDYYTGYAGDTFGTFYAIGQIMDKCVTMLNSVSFFGMSLWNMMVTGFLITILISFLTLFVIPSNNGGFSVKGGNTDEFKKRVNATREDILDEYRNSR